MHRDWGPFPKALAGFLNALEGPSRHRPGPADGREPEKYEGGGRRLDNSGPGLEGQGLDAE
jgi:hypothetical protein